MEVVKKNILSIICGVVALAAILFHLVYTSRGFGKLKTEAEAAVKPLDRAGRCCRSRGRSRRQPTPRRRSSRPGRSPTSG